MKSQGIALKSQDKSVKSQGIALKSQENTGKYPERSGKYRKIPGEVGKIPENTREVGGKSGEVYLYRPLARTSTFIAGTLPTRIAHPLAEHRSPGKQTSASWYGNRSTLGPKA